MQVTNVESEIVSASNGGCDAFDVNRSLASGIADLKPAFANTPLSMLALSVIANQPSDHHAAVDATWADLMPRVNGKRGG